MSNGQKTDKQHKMFNLTEKEKLRQENFGLRIENQKLQVELGKSRKVIFELENLVEKFRSNEISLREENVKIMEAGMALFKKHQDHAAEMRKVVQESEANFRTIVKTLKEDLEKKNEEVKALKASEKPLEDAISKLFVLMDKAKAQKFQPAESFRAKHMLKKHEIQNHTVELNEHNPLLNVLLSISGDEFGERVQKLLNQGGFKPKNGAKTFTTTSSLIFGDFVFDISPMSGGKVGLTVRELKTENLLSLNSKVVHFRRSRRTVSV